MATLRKSRKTMLIPWMILVMGLSVIGGVSGQSIITHPKDVTETIGGTANFTCKVYFDGLRNMMEWQCYNELVYVYQNGAEDFPEGQEKYSIAKDESGTFTLIVKHLGHQDAGIYTCDASGAAAKAVLLVLETPTIITPKPDPEAGQTVQYSCTAKFSGPRRYEIPPEQYPKLRMFFGGKQLEGIVVEKEEQDESRTRYEFLQVHNVTLNASMHGKNLTCDTGTPNPEMNVNFTTQVMVLSSVRTITYSPTKDQYPVGDVISCIADGSPKPEFIWDDIKNAGHFVTGSALEITEQMVGSNTWRCTARNTVSGLSHQKHIVAEFNVVLHEEQESAGDDSWKYAVAISTPICIIIGSVVACVLCYLMRKMKHATKKQLADQGENSMPLLRQQGDAYAELNILTIACGKDGRKWEEKIREIIKTDAATTPYLVQTYHSLEKVESKFKGFNNSTKKTDSEKLIIILSNQFKVHVMNYVDSLKAYPVWLPNATIIVDLPAKEIPDWLEKRGIKFIDAGKYAEIGIKRLISQSLFGGDSVERINCKKSNIGSADKTYSSDIGSIAEGLAWSYFLNYINLIGLTIGDRIKKYETREGLAKGSIPKKLFILLPSSCYSHPKLGDADPAITEAGKLEPHIRQIAGNTRNYETAVHKVTVDTETYYVCAEYCTPALVLYKMSVKGVAGTSQVERNAHLHVFYHFLRTILDHPYFPQFCKNIKLVAYKDKEDFSEKEKKVPLSEILVGHIKACLDTEKH